MWSGRKQWCFFAFDAGFVDGANVAGGDFDGDRFGDIIAGAGPGAGPDVKVFSGRTGLELASFYAYAEEFHGGVFAPKTIFHHLASRCSSLQSCPQSHITLKS